MNFKELLGYGVMMTIGSIIAKKYKTRERTAAYLAKMTWMQRIGLALCVIFTPLYIVSLIVFRR